MKILQRKETKQMDDEINVDVIVEEEEVYTDAISDVLKGDKRR